MPIDPSKVQWDTPSAASTIDVGKVQWDVVPTARPNDAAPQGRSGRVREAFTRPADTSNIATPTGTELADRWKDSVLGAGAGIVAAPFGLVGDIEGLGRAVGNRVMNPTDATPYSGGTFFPTSEGVANTWFGKPASAYEAGGRALGGAAIGLAGPAGAAKLVAPLKSAETAAAMSRTETVARRAAQLGLDPLSAAIEGGGAAKNAMTTALSSAGDVLFAPNRNAANTLLRVGGAPEALDAIEATRGLPVTPNAPAATFAQRVASQGNTNPAFAGLEQGLVNVNTPTGREAYNLTQQRAQAIQDQLNRIDAQLQQNANAMVPNTNTPLSSVREQVVARLDQEQAALAAIGESIAKGLPDVGQRAPGEAIAQSAATMRRDMKTKEVSPRMEKPLEMAGDQPINVQNIVSKAEEILGQPLSSFSPSTAPETVRILSRLLGQQEPGTFVQLGERGGYSVPGAQLDPASTLRELDAMRSAINKDYATAAQSSAPGADARLRNIKQLHSEIDKSVEASNLSPEIKAGWKEGSRFYREEYVPAAKTGITADMLKKTYRNVPTLLPDNVISSVLSNETNTAQIITSLKNYPEAGEALKIGIADKFRADVVDKTTGLVDPAKADKFFKDNARNLNMLQDAGIDVQSSLQQARTQAANLKKGMDSLAETAKRLGKPEDAEGLVSTTLKSPVDMDFVYKRLDGDGRSALAYELTERALAPIREGNPATALKYLEDNAKAVKAGLGPKGNKIHADLVGLSKFQEKFQAIEKSAVKPTVPTTTQLQNVYRPKELTDLAVVADEIARINKVDALAKQSGESAKLANRLATEEALQGGVSAAAIPNKISSLYTTIKNVFKRNEAKMNEKTSAALIYYMYKDPDAAAAAMRAALKRREPKAPVTAAQPLTIPVGAAAATTRLNAMAPQDAR